ncbi:ABC transporter ATP-binding protein [Niabella yanshanensis]|uniref:ABC transporter ATP-binding protein n=1 Tax=Niabella yanshanensis TaxID=577386 RepID=A0ABZ0W6E8_9BACT|nr:ABC transporter ATP-binding protein [Niabella yanshanensis]WQD38239.1 ABC transporter ATP-binding protein [Niabella yanshanensis]
MDPIIQLKGLTKCYGTLKAVDELNLDIQKGEVFGLLGPNGAGKTTTILMMLGLSEPTAGSAWVSGINATSRPIEVKRKLGYMPDSVGFYDNMTALENLVYLGRLNGLPEQEVKSHAEEMMQVVGLSAHLHQKTSTYSRGMKQRLGLADVLIKKPEVIILDEPTLGIDPAGVKDFLNLIKELSVRHGLTVLLSSHHLHQVQQVCDRVGIFVKGKLLAEGSIHALSGNLFNRDGYTTAITLGTAPLEPLPLDNEPGPWEAIKKTELVGDTIYFSCSNDITARLVKLYVEKGFDVTGVQRKEYGLEDIYQKYFENNSIEETANEKSEHVIKKSFFRKRKAW